MYITRIPFLFFLLFIFSCNSTPTEKEVVEAPTKATTEKIVEEAVVPVVEIKLPDYDTTIWTDILFLDTTIQVDMKYATTDNFVQEKMYNCSRCFLRPEVALAVLKAQQKLVKKGYGLKMLDC